MKQVNRTKLNAAAFLFSKGKRTAKALAKEVNVAEGTIYKWAKLPEWDTALDALKYDGDRSFEREPRRDNQRDNAELIADAKVLFDAAKADKQTDKQAVSSVCRLLGIKDRRRVNKWRKLWEVKDKETT